MHRLIILIAILTFTIPVQAQTYSKGELEGQLERMMEWWPGEYDNHEQVVRKSGGGAAALVYEPIYRIHSHIIKLDRPDLGENVLYVEEYRNGDPSNIYRARVYALSVDEAEEAVRVKPHAFKSGNESMVGAWSDPERLAAIKADDLEPYSDSCDINMRWEGGQFRGGPEPETCDAPTEEESWYDYQVILGPKYQWDRVKAISKATGEVTWEGAEGSNFAWIQMAKARRFTCTVNYNLEGDMLKTEFLTEIEVHDQGGATDIEWPDGRTLEFQLHTREFASPSERVFPLFRVNEKGNPVPISYAWAVDDADRFGINLGWFYALCSEKELEESTP